MEWIKNLRSQPREVSRVHCPNSKLGIPALCAGMLVAIAAPNILRCEDYELTWQTTDTGAPSSLEQGSYTLYSSVGQPDSGLLRPALPSPYELEGGFLFRFAPGVGFLDALGDLYVLESVGNAGLTVEIRERHTSIVSIRYVTVNESAVAGANYAARTGIITFLPGESTKTISIPISDDAEDSPDTSFRVELSSLSGVPINQSSLRVHILDDDDGNPSLMVRDLSPAGSGTYVGHIQRPSNSQLGSRVTYQTGAYKPSILDLRGMLGDTYCEFFLRGRTSFGDFNADGYDDALLWEDDYSGLSQGGLPLRILFGSPTLKPKGIRAEELATLPSDIQMATINGDFSDPFYSITYTSGDFNGDDIADVAMLGDGEIRILLGSSLLPTSGEVDLTANSADIRMYDIADGRLLGAGDFDYDGLDDLIIHRDPDNGNAPPNESIEIVYAVSLSTQQDLDYGDRQYNYTILQAPVETGTFGLRCVVVGEMDADGYLDLALGCPTSPAMGGSVVLYRGALIRDRIDRVNEPGDPVIQFSEYWIRYLGDTNAEIGTHQSVGDWDGDGMDDLAFSGSSLRNGVYVADQLSSRADGLTVSLTAANGWGGAHARKLGLFNSQEVDYPLMSLGSGDQDADGLQDILIGFPQLTQETGNAQSRQVGFGAVIPGRSLVGFDHLRDLGLGTDLVGCLGGAGIGVTSQGGGDLDGDGFPDMIYTTISDSTVTSDDEGPCSTHFMTYFGDGDRDGTATVTRYLARENEVSDLPFVDFGPVVGVSLRLGKTSSTTPLAYEVSKSRNVTPVGLGNKVVLPCLWQLVPDDDWGDDPSLAISISYQGALSALLAANSLGRLALHESDLRIYYRQLASDPSRYEEVFDADGSRAIWLPADTQEFPEPVGYCSSKEVFGSIALNSTKKYQFAVVFDPQGCDLADSRVQSDVTYPTPTATPPAGVNATWQHDRYHSSGSRFPLQPSDLEAAPGSDSPKGHLLTDSPNPQEFYSVLTAQAVYANEEHVGGLPEGQVTRLTGSTIAASTQLASGLNQTREINAVGELRNSVKYLMGHAKNATLIEGGTFHDNNQAVALIASASTAFEAGTANNSVHSLVGADHRALLGKLADPEDARSLDIDPGREIPSGRVYGLAGAKSAVFLDSKPVDDVEKTWGGTREPSYIHTAMAARGEVGRRYNDGSFLVDHAIGTRVELSLKDGNASDAYRAAAETPVYRSNGSNIRNWIGIGEEAGPFPLQQRTYSDLKGNPEQFTLDNGLLVQSQIPGKGRGSSIRQLPLIRPDLPAPPESTANVVINDSVVVGDGQVDSFGQGDDLCVRGAVKFAPRAAHPVLDSDLAASDKQGLLYFDAEANRLKVSLPGSGGSIVWASLAIESETATTTPTPTPTPDAAVHGAYVAPRIFNPELKRIPPPGPEADRALTFSVSTGFTPERLYYRRLGIGYQSEGESQWVAASGGPTAWTISFSAVSIVFDTIEDSQPGQIIEIIAVSNDGRSAGTSFEYYPEADQ